MQTPSVSEVQALVATHATSEEVRTRFDYSDLGFAMHRDHLRIEGFRALEELLSSVPLLVFDFNMGPEDLAQNLHDGTSGFRADYAGMPGPRGGTIFRVDHHYPVVAQLNQQSTTPMVLSWLKGLHAAGQSDLLEEVARSRYLANHWDCDILFSQHLARKADDRSYLEAVGPILEAAALRNDHVELPERELETMEALAYNAGQALDAKVTAGELRYHDVQANWLPRLGRWIAGGPRCDQLAAWATQSHQREQERLAVIRSWDEAGRLRQELGGRLVVLDGEHPIQNATCYFYLRHSRPFDGKRIQLLYFLEAPGHFKYKLRSHGGANLTPLYEHLRRSVAEAGFNGRFSAGGSKLTTVPPERVLEQLRQYLENHDWS